VATWHRLAGRWAEQSTPMFTSGKAYGVGYVLRETGDFVGSLAALAEAVAAYRACGDHRGEGLALRSMAMTHRAAGDLAAAADHAGESIEVLAALGDELLTAYARQTLAKVHIRQGRHRLALDPLKQALVTCRAFHDEFGTALMLRTLGELHLAGGDARRAEEYLTRARERFDTLDFPLFRARAERDLAVALERTGRPAAAHAVRTAALTTFAALGSREYAELSAPTAAATAAAAAVLQPG